MKKLTILALIIFLSFTAACNGDRLLPAPTEANGTEDEEPEEVFEIIRDLGGRHIRIASGWAYLPFSTGGPPPDPDTSRNYVMDRLLYNQIQRISREYNVTISPLPIPHSDIMPALQTSVMAGEPFADMVLLGGDMVFPAITGNLIYALEEFVQIDAGLWNPSNNLRPCANFVGFYWTFAPFTMNLEGSFLGVNLDIIHAAGAYNPATLYENGEWTFDRFREIMLLSTNVYYGQFGISGVPGDIIAHLIAANDGIMVYDYSYAYDDARTIAALEFAFQIFRTDGTWLSEHGVQDWHNNFFAFTEGRSAFFPVGEWTMQQANVNFENTIVPFPRGPDNERPYSFMKGFGMGLAVPRGVYRPEDVYTIFEGIFNWAGEYLLIQRDHEYVISLFPSDADALRAVNILRDQGKFDLGMAVPAFNWVHTTMAEGFVNGTMNVSVAVERFRNPQQMLLDEALENWLLR